MCVNFNCIFFRESMQLDLNKTIKTPFISGAFSNIMSLLYALNAKFSMFVRFNALTKSFFSELNQIIF